MNNHPIISQTLAAETPVNTERFWQHPFVQNVLPFLTSIMLHLAVVVIGFIFFYTFRQVMSHGGSMQQFAPSEGTIVTENFNSAVPNPGTGGDPIRKMMQDRDRDVPPDSRGLSSMPGKELTSILTPGGGSGDAISDGLIGIGGAGFGKGKHGLGNSEGDDTGGGKGHGGVEAPFGVPGGGDGKDGVPKFIGEGAVPAKEVVFICDATGSMMSQFDNLRVELRKAVEGLKVPQAFNVIFFQEDARPPISKTLLLATPANKQRIYDFVDNYTPRGRTDPIPAIKAAFAMHPDLIFFLCDPSDFPDPSGTVELFKTLNADHKCKVFTISFMDEDHAGEDTLKRIAADSGGKFRCVSDEEMGK